jgi:hypothetical protein
MSESMTALRIEPRWPVATAVTVVLVLLELLPGRITLLPWWVPYVLGAVVLAPVAAVGFTAGGARWLRLEHRVTLAVFVAVSLGTIANLANLVHAMARKPAGITGLQLLASSVAIWLTNLLVFALLFWRTDRGGPEARVSHRGGQADWLFPQESAPGPDVSADWHPAFVDYLFVAYSTATSFGASYAMPITTRAKLLMMLEGTLSLVIMVVVLSRAINILGN